MTNLPEDEAREPALFGHETTAGQRSRAARFPAEHAVERLARPVSAEFPPGEPEAPSPIRCSCPMPTGPARFLTRRPSRRPALSRQLFQSFAQPAVRPPVRIPHFGHLGLLPLLLESASFAQALCSVSPRASCIFGANALAHAAATNVPLMLASEAILYLFTFGSASSSFRSSGTRSSSRDCNGAARWPSKDSGGSPPRRWAAPGWLRSTKSLCPAPGTHPSTKCSALREPHG